MQKIKIGGSKIVNEKYIKFLGVWIDSELNLNEHISRLTPKTQMQIRVAEAK